MTTQIRLAIPADLAALQSIEDAADALLVEALSPNDWGSPPSGAERAAEPGFVLVAVDETGGATHRVLGFAHVLEPGGVAHLEQVSVAPEAGRQGLGRQLVTEALAEAARRGYREVTLRTFAEVPFNAPFYASLGFLVSEPSDEFHRELLKTERRLGLDQLGPRVQMSISLPHP